MVASLDRDAAYRYRGSSVACLCVCLSVSYSGSWALQKRLNRSKCRLGRWLGGRNHVLDGGRSRSPRGRDNFWGCLTHESTVSHCSLLRCTQQKSSSRLHCCRLADVTLTFPRKKFAPLRCGHSLIKILWLDFLRVVSVFKRSKYYRNSVRPSVCHIRALCRNDWPYHRTIHNLIILLSWVRYLNVCKFLPVGYGAWIQWIFSGRLHILFT